MTEKFLIDDYPEHAKLVEVKPYSQACGAFIEWLSANGFTICRWDELSDAYYPASVGIERILAKHFGIDLKVLEDEKLAMLEKIRRANAKT